LDERGDAQAAIAKLAAFAEDWLPDKWTILSIWKSRATPTRERHPRK